MVAFTTKYVYIVRIPAPASYSRRGFNVKMRLFHLTRLSFIMIKLNVIVKDYMKIKLMFNDKIYNLMRHSRVYYNFSIVTFTHNHIHSLFLK